MSQETSKVEINYIRTQVIAYFLFALLFMRAIVLRVLPAPVTPVPFSAFHFNDWIILTLAFLCVGISLFFLVALFLKQYMPKALCVAIWLSFPFSSALVASFIVAWITGLNPLIGLPNLLREIFFYTGFGLFLALEIHFSIEHIVKRTATKKDSQSATEPSKMKRIWRWFWKQACRFYPVLIIVVVFGIVLLRLYRDPNLTSSTVAVATFALAIFTYLSIDNQRQIHRREIRERQLNEIINWATGVHAKASERKRNIDAYELFDSWSLLRAGKTGKIEIAKELDEQFGGVVQKAVEDFVTLDPDFGHLVDTIKPKLEDCIKSCEAVISRAQQLKTKNM